MLDDLTDFKKKIQDLATRSRTASKQALTEEATKTSVILPLIRALGFDVFDLSEVVPEFVADVGVKKGEKVDFALFIDGKPTILVEAKPISMTLGTNQLSQLYRYFAVTDARLAILTNGQHIWFFSDTDAPNKMDKRPFFIFNLHHYDDGQLEELARFRKEGFDIGSIIEAASNLKYTKAAASFLKAQLQQPDDDFVKLVARQIHEGSVTKGVMEQLRPIIQAALDEVIRDRIQEKLGVTFSKPVAVQDDAAETAEPINDKDDGIETTEEELQAFMIVRAIGASTVPIHRIEIRDARSYCAILMDNNNRKPICRLHFNAKSKKFIEIFNAEKERERFDIEDISDIYQYSEKLKAVIAAYA